MTNEVGKEMVGWHNRMENRKGGDSLNDRGHNDGPEGSNGGSVFSVKKVPFTAGPMDKWISQTIIGSGWL